MGQSAELMAKLNGISRADQDAWALGSHRKAAAAWQDGRLAAEVAPVYVTSNGGRAVTHDNHIRPDTSLDKLAQLKPVFDKQLRHGDRRQLEPADGWRRERAADVRRARAGAGLCARRRVIKSYAYAAVDPAGQLLLGPAYAIPQALDRAGITLADIDLVEMHEAFAAQVLSTLQKLESDEFAETELGRSKAVGMSRPESNQPQRRIDRARPSVRRHRRALRHHARQRDGAPVGAVRPGFGVRRRRRRRGDRPGAALIALGAAFERTRTPTMASRRSSSIAPDDAVNAINLETDRRARARRCASIRAARLRGRRRHLAPRRTSGWPAPT